MELKEILNQPIEVDNFSSSLVTSLFVLLGTFFILVAVPEALSHEIFSQALTLALALLAFISTIQYIAKCQSRFLIMPCIYLLLTVIV